MPAPIEPAAAGAASQAEGARAGAAPHHAIASKTSVFALIDQAPMTPVRYVYWLLASGGTFLDGFSVVSLGIAVPLIGRDMRVDPLLIGLIGSALVLGAVFGGALGGVAADAIGRKRTFVADMTILSAGAAICAVAPNPWVLLAGQFLIGTGIGIDFATSASYVSEIMPRAVRSRMTIATIALQSVGMIAAALAALVVLTAHPAIADWRLLFGLCGVLGLVYVAARLRLPESPRWLAEKDRLGEAAAVLARLTGVPVSLVRTEMAPATAQPKRPPSALGLSALLAPRYRARTLLVCLPWLLMDVATYGVALFTPVILGAMHFGGTGDGPIARVAADTKGSGIVDLFLLLGFVVGMWAVPRVGRIPMQVAGFAGMSFGMLLLLLAALAGHGPPMQHLGLVIAGFVIFNFAMNAGPNATTFTLAPVLFPTAIRASASGVAAACAKVGATVGTFVVPQLQAAWGLIGVLALMAVVSAGGLVATAALAHVVDEEADMEETPDERPAAGALV